MPVTDRFARLALDQIVVLRDDRQRREIKTEDLEGSIAKRGVLQPILVRREGLVLVAGERRLETSRKLGLADIPVRFVEDLSQTELAIIELEENIKRSDLEWQDLVAAVGKIHQLYRALDPDWTQGETAEACNLTTGTVSLYLKVASQMAAPRIAEAGTVREAHNIIQRAESRLAGEALQELLDLPAPVAPEALPEVERKLDVVGANGEILAKGIYPPVVVPLRPLPPPEPIITASFLDWAPQYSGPKFNLIHCDFPYGVELFSGPQGRGAEPEQGGQVGYQDSPDVYWALVESLCTNLDRLMSVSGHLMFWLSADDEMVWKTRQTFARLAPSLEFYKFRLVWLKSDNAGISAVANRWPRHVYEIALLATRGKRQIVKIVGDAYSAPTDKRLHASTKPEPMLRHFMTMLVDGGTRLLDPTCGSGAALRAAESLGAAQVHGLEIDAEAAEVARSALRQSRALRGASAAAAD